MSFLWPRKVTFSYAKSNCFTNPVLMPRLVTNGKSQTYQARPKASLSIAGYPLYSHRTCITPTQAPKEHVVETISFGTPLIKKSISVSHKTFPAIINQAKLDQPLSTGDPLVLEMNMDDLVFGYQLFANNKSVGCSKRNKSLVCDITGLSLAQSAKYDLVLQRLFNGQPSGEVFRHTVATVENVHIMSSSITADQTVYDVPTQLTLTLNRPAVSIERVHLYQLQGDSRQEVPVTAQLDGQIVTVRFNQPLTRSVSFVLTVERLSAADGGYLPAPFSLPFKTSGGPKVVGLNIGSYKVGLTDSVIINFDSAVSTSQALPNFIHLEVGGQLIPTAITAQNNRIIIKPSAPLPRCTALTVKVLDGLQNAAGIAGGSAWQFRSRTICQAVFGIGGSVQGRGITGYSFGSGPSKVIFVGTIHGDEKSAAYLLNNWIDYLERNPDVIPGSRTVVVIPSANPDGYSLNRRTNANNVDLNRNFPTNNWKSGVSMPDGTYNEAGGGPAPLSEPESKALANYISGQNPRLVLSYHAAAGVVIPNDAGDSVALAQTYDQKSNVHFLSNSQTGSVFKYDTTGAFEDWLNERLGIPGLTIELWSKTSNEYAKHQAAMLAMIQIP